MKLMWSFGLAVFLLSFNAQAELNCFSEQSPFHIIVNEETSVADVYENGNEVARLGCEQLRVKFQGFDVPTAFMRCHDVHGSDAGYSATFLRGGFAGLTQVNLFLNVKMVASHYCNIRPQ